MFWGKKHFIIVLDRIQTARASRRLAALATRQKCSAEEYPKSTSPQASRVCATENFEKQWCSIATENAGRVTPRLLQTGAEAEVQLH